MKNSSILILAIITLCIATTANARYSGGKGTPEAPYRIATAEDLNNIGNHTEDWNACFVLTNDVNLSAFTGTQFNIIGNSTTMFTGVFDGNDHKIWNFTWTSTSRNGIGLFSWVGGSGQIKNLGMENVNVNAETGDWASGLVGFNYYHGTITNCYSIGIVSGTNYVAGLVGYNDYGSTIANCYSAGIVSGTNCVGGLVAQNWTFGMITDCYSTSVVDGNERVGGLMGFNDGPISNCYSTGSISGTTDVGGFVAYNGGPITNCYSTGSVAGEDYVGGLVGDNNYGKITNCYSTGLVSGTGYQVGGLVGSGGIVVNSFWDIKTSCQSTSAGGTPKTTAEMKKQSTFTNAGWDFITPIWMICEGLDYPRLWWEFGPPVLKAEPQQTIGIGTSNLISWSAVSDANAYWVECAEDANFQYLVDTSGWISQTSYVFFGLETGVTYWYRVKAGYYCDIESWWSNVESSTQVQLADAVLTLLEPNDVKNENMLQSLANKLNAIQDMMDNGQYKAAIYKLQNDILQKTDGCAETGAPDKNDWIITCERQELVYPIIIELIDLLENLI